jgi:ribosome biogenesis GTPase / thiamine phosphate phosphatase
VRVGDSAFLSALTPLGFDDRWAALLAAQPAEAEPLRVVRDSRGTVIATDGRADLTLETPPDLRPVTGDWIAVAEGRIVDILERVSAIVRPRVDGQPQVLAANIDFVAVVHGLDQPLNRRRLERGLVLAWDSGARPVIVLTKADLADDVAGVVREAEQSGPGVEVLPASAVDGRGLDDIRALLRANRTMVFIGASGSGKSSLVNALLERDAMATRQVRRGDGKGRHETTHRQLLALPGGGMLMDTPGLRALTVGAATDGVDKAFPDIEAQAADCRFRDCRHDNEPACAVRAAVDSGAISADRFEGWRRIRREADSARLREDPIALRQRDRQYGRAVHEEAVRLKRGRHAPRR